MNIKTTTLTAIYTILLLAPTNSAYPQWQSKFVKESESKITYTPDSKGDIIPYFGKVGYHKGETMPEVEIVKTITAPSKGDAQELIQNAIDEVAKMPVNQLGFRGAILLKKGIYKIPGKVTIPAGGIVLKGEGNHEQGTVVVASGKGQRTLLTVSGKGSSTEIPGSRVEVTDTYVPVGSFSFQVKDAALFKPGDLIMLFRPGTENWIHDLQMDRIIGREGTKQWKAKEYDLRFERIITKIEGNKIFIDQPVVMAIDKAYGGGSVYKIVDSRIRENGIENILFKSDYISETDEDHGWYAIQFQNCEDGWVRNVTSKYFGNGCVSMSGGSKYITVTDSKCLEAKSVITGGRRYSFNIGGQMCLVMNCESTDARHDFVTGSRVCGPNVFYNCKAANTHADIGPHHRWCVGTLYDNITTDGEINVQDRGNWGSGHGWSGANQLLWNCKVKAAAVQNPWVSAKNWCIGLTGAQVSGWFKDRMDGEWEGLNQQGLTPVSLYLAQKNQTKR
jgi:hypothetical protein